MRPVGRKISLRQTHSLASLELSRQKQQLASLLFMLKSNKKPNGRYAPRRQAAIEPLLMGPGPPQEV